MHEYLNIHLRSHNTHTYTYIYIFIYTHLHVYEFLGYPKRMKKWEGCHQWSKSYFFPMLLVMSRTGWRFKWWLEHASAVVDGKFTDQLLWTWQSLSWLAHSKIQRNLGCFLSFIARNGDRTCMLHTGFTHTWDLMGWSKIHLFSSLKWYDDRTWFSSFFGQTFFWFWVSSIFFFIDACDDDHACLFFDGGLRLWAPSNDWEWWQTPFRESLHKHEHKPLYWDLLGRPWCGVYT